MLLKFIMKNKTLIVFFAFLLSISNLFSQNEKLDSLIDLYNNTSEKDIKIELLSEISNFSLRIRDYEKTLFYAQKGIDISQKNNDKNAELEFLEIFANCYYHSSNYDKSLEYFKLIFKLSDEYNILEKRRVAFSGLSKNYWRKGMHDEAIYFETEAIKISENLNDTVNTYFSKGNLGTVYLDMGDYDRADKIYDELLISFKKANDFLGVADVYEKKGAVKFFQGYNPYARKYYNQALEIYEKEGLDLEVAIEVGNIAETYEMEGDYKKAINLYKEAIKIEKEYNYYSGLIFIYKAIGRSYFKIKQYKKAKESYFKSLNYIDKIGEKRELTDVYKLLNELFAKIGDYKNAYKYSRLTMQVNDSISGVRVRNQINDIRIKYETEKKENENKLLKKTQVLQEQMINVQKKQNRKQYFVIIIISVLLISILIFSVLLFKINKKNKRTGIILKNKNILLNEAYSDINTSIEYAGKIQQAMLSTFEEINHDFSEYAIFYKPSSVLSGDFYWSKRINDIIYIAVADSTGHGIPGALLSITGMSYLNEIVTEDFIQTGTILNNLRDKIKKSLNQKGNFHEHKDGWDMSIFSYNQKTSEVQFSGAYNSLYLIKGKVENKSMIKYKADRQPVGIHYKEIPFTVHNFKVEKGDIIWLFTDGYSDQYNNEGNKKFSSKLLKKLLLSISDKTMNEQNKILKNEFEKWKGNFNQIDDVLVTGIKI